ncbi:MAG TPA: hypothetical protein VJR89_26090 [Polyangiales bacterium]|nr:hypothetical protein [Polyangiales bacterium]
MAKNLDASAFVRAVRPEQVVKPPQFSLAELAGRLVELSGDGASAVLTWAVGLVLDAQAAGEPVAWLGSDASSFYPPDAAESGVDLESLLVVRVNAHARARPLAEQLASAAERLLRSGAFGLCVLDLGPGAQLAQSAQSRLLGLAQRHAAAVLCLTHKAESSPSLGSLVSLRASAVRVWLGSDRFACELRVHKDKRRGPVWSQREVCRGPLGLR